jgi:hypothetical protein
MTAIIKSSIPLHGIDVYKNQFHKGIEFSQGADSVESIPGVLKSLKIRALDWENDIIRPGLRPIYIKPPSLYSHDSLPLTLFSQKANQVLALGNTIVSVNRCYICFSYSLPCF